MVGEVVSEALGLDVGFIELLSMILDECQRS
jgi:hypothetical protein